MKMIKPVKGNWRISCDYECHLEYSTAPGIDYAVPEMTAVRAVLGGTVHLTRWGDRGGRYMMLRHGEDTYTLYSHLRCFCAAEGEKVTQGQTIAYSGNTGHSTGPHLHWAVKKNGQWVPPEQFLGEPQE